MGDRPLTVGILSPLVAGAYFGQILDGIARCVARYGGRTVAIQTLDASIGDHYPGVVPFRSRVALDNVDGIVVVIKAAPDDFLGEVRSNGRPMVTISHQVPVLGCPEVLPDNRAGMAQAVGHLISHGHERIAFTGYTGLPDVSERYEGYLDTLRAHGLQPGPNLYFPAPNSCEDGGELAGRAMLAAGVPFSALAAATDLNALGAGRVLREAGVDIPSQVAIAGFDDMAFSANLTPPLTTVRQNFDLLSETATRLLFELIEGRDVAPRQYRVKTSLVTRGSCGCTAPAPRVSPPAGQIDPGAARERFRTSSRTGLHGAHLGAAQASALDTATERLLDCYSEALACGQPDRAQIARATEDIFSLSPRPETTDILVEALAAFRRDLLAGNFSAERLAVLDACQREVSLALHGAEARAVATTIDSLQTSLRDEYYVSMGLLGLRRGQGGLRDEGMKPLSLDWLGGTHAKAACLGLWTGRGSRRLRVVSTYGTGTPGSPSPGTVVDEERFPPLDALAGRPEQEIVFVLPVRTSENDWGMLAVTGPAEPAAKTGRDVYFQWAALLGIALDHGAVVESLQRQRADLAEAYRRQRELMAEVTASEERYALAARAANDGLWDWDLVAASVFYSPRWKAMLGFADADIGTSPGEWLGRVHSDDALQVRELVAACSSGRQSSLQVEHRVRAKDGTYRWALCRAAVVCPPGKAPTRLVGSLTDITERKELENRLLQAALYDSLTGLANRSLFVDRMARAAARTKRQPGYQFCVLFIDLDGFKVVNDTLGHVYGDLLLVQVADRIRAHLRENDTPVRYGGDEFAVLLDAVTGPEQVDMVVRRLEQALCQPYELEGHEVVVSATLGAASSGPGLDDPGLVLRAADSAMYRSKVAKRALTGGTVTLVTG